MPWKELNVDVVIESTGFFTNKVNAEKHLAAGSKFVVISGPTKDTPTVVHGVNTKDGKVSASLAQVVQLTISFQLLKFWEEELGLKKQF